MIGNRVDVTGGAAGKTGGGIGLTYRDHWDADCFYFDLRNLWHEIRTVYSRQRTLD